MTLQFPEQDPSLLLIISGPAGCGKTTLCDRLVASHSEIQRVITCTTRAPRPGEADGEDYHFFTDDRFEEALARDEFLEHASVHGARYGTLKHEVEEKLARQISLVLNIDVQGAASLRRAARSDELLQGRLVSVFVLPASLAVLRERMLTRGTDADDAIEQRLDNAREEMEQWPEYDYCIRSGTRDGDFHQLESILVAERRKVDRLLQAGE